MDKKPPELALKFLYWFCKKDHLEEIEGDLFELFEKNQSCNPNKANWLFFKDVLSHFRWDYIRFFSRNHRTNHLNMLSSYFKIALRNIKLSKAFSAINIAGLMLGMVCFLFIFLWIQDEKSIDNFHKNGANLYTVYQTIKVDGKVIGNSSTPMHNADNRLVYPLEGVEEVVPEIEKVSFYASGYELPWGHSRTFKIDDKIFKAEGGRASKDFFAMFDYPIIAGDAKTPLIDIDNIAISRKMANLFFSTPAEAIGKTLLYENYLPLKITAVFEDVPVHSSLKFEYLTTWMAHKQRMPQASHNSLCTIQLADKVDIPHVEKSINQYLQTQLEENEAIEISVGLQPFRDRYLVANFVNGKPANGRIDYLHIFSGVALFILLLACINFMNLSTARAAKRAKEVGIRKVIGSTRSNLIGQFLGESILMALIALIFSIVAVGLLLPYFNTFTEKQIVLSLMEPDYWAIFLGLILITGLVAGSYPAFFLSNLQPVQVLKGTMRFTKSSKWFRKGLTVFQFSLSIFLLIATLVVSRQINFVQNTHLGYDRDNMIYVRIEGDLSNLQNYNRFKRQALQQEGVAMVDRSSEAPHAMNFEMVDPFKWEGKNENAQVGFKPTSVGWDFLEMMNLEIVEGRGFSKQIATDSAEAFMVNEEAIRQMGIEEPIGKSISAWKKKGRIVGILKDFHTHSLHEPIKPFILDIKETLGFGVIMIRIKAGKTATALANLEKVYKEVNPNHAFAYQFMDLEYKKMYQSEQVIARLSNLFALLAILISCLGLLGLSMFSIQSRFKEIGIRKVLGASTSSIVALFSNEFLSLIGIAFLLAIPLSWKILNDWLQGFAYRVELSWWIFALGGIFTLLVAFCTVSSQSLKAAFSNPVDTLRSE